MGKADFYHAQQKTRKNLWRDIAVSDNMQEVFRRYDIFNRVFPLGNMARPTREAKAEGKRRKGQSFHCLAELPRADYGEHPARQSMVR